MKTNQSDGRTKATFIFLAVWGAIQIMRFIAIPLMIEVANNRENPAWMFPAILDTVVALGSCFFLFVLWKKRNFFTWMFSVTLFVVSVIDHIDGAVAAILTVTPVLFGGPDSSKTGTIISFIIPTLIDIAAIYLLSKITIRNKFFTTGE